MKGQLAVAKAIKDGRLPPVADVPCRACGGKATSYHHHGYAEGMELAVVPVCPKCHSRIHHALIADPGTGHFWCRDCRSSTGCNGQHNAAQGAHPGASNQLNIQVEDEEMEGYKARARAAGYSTLAEYVRHVLNGRIHVVVGSESEAPPATKGRGRPKASE